MPPTLHLYAQDPHRTQLYTHALEKLGYTVHHASPLTAIGKGSIALIDRVTYDDPAWRTLAAQRRDRRPPILGIHGIGDVEWSASLDGRIAESELLHMGSVNRSLEFAFATVLRVNHR